MPKARQTPGDPPVGGLALFWRVPGQLWRYDWVVLVHGRDESEGDSRQILSDYVSQKHCWTVNGSPPAPPELDATDDDVEEWNRGNARYQQDVARSRVYILDHGVFVYAPNHTVSGQASDLFQVLVEALNNMQKPGPINLMPTKGGEGPWR